jgi:putative transposase
MPRPPRLQLANGIYHVTTRGNRGTPIFLDAIDRQVFLRTLRLVFQDRDWRCHAFCLMTTHYHLLFTTPKPDLARGMHRLNSRYAHYFNERHVEDGHVFQSRYRSPLVDTEEYLLKIYRYIARNPVRAGICRRASEWRWSSYAHVCRTARPALPSDERWLLSHFGGGERGRRSLLRLVEVGV